MQPLSPRLPSTARQVTNRDSEEVLVRALPSPGWRALFGPDFDCRIKGIKRALTINRMYCTELYHFSTAAFNTVPHGFLDRSYIMLPQNILGIASLLALCAAPALAVPEAFPASDVSAAHRSCAKHHEGNCRCRGLNLVSSIVMRCEYLTDDFL